MPEQNVTTKFKVDVSEFKAGIAEANKEIKLANAEFKAASSGLDDWENSTEGLQAKLKQLESVIAAENAKLKAYQGQLEAVENASKENAKRAEELRTAYQEAVRQFGENSDEAKALKKALSDVTKEQTANEKAADNLRVTVLNQTAAVNKAKREYRGFTDELNDLERGADSAESSLEDLDSAASNSGDGFTIAKGAIADFISDGIQNLISKAAEGVKALLSLPEATREFREDMAKLTTAFTDAGHSTDAAEKAYRDFYGILGESDRSVEAVNHLAMLTDNEKDLATWTDIAAGVTAKFGDSLPIEGLTEAANETAKVGKVTGPLADALNWAGVSEDDFNESLEKCNDEQERSRLITETLNGLYSDAAKQYSDMNENIIAAREATADYEQAQADLGAALEPVTTKITELKTKGLQWLIDVGLPGVQTGIEWMRSNIPTVVTVLGGLTAAFVAQKLAMLAATAAEKGMTLAQYAAAGAQKLLNAAMKANPIGLIIVAITALVAAFVYLWNNSEEFRQFWINLWENIKEVAQAVWTVIVAVFKVAWEKIKSVWSAVSGFFANVWDGIKAAFSAVGSWFGEKFTAAKESVLEAWSNIKEKFSEIWTKIKDAFNFGDMLDIGKQLLEGLWNGISDKVAWLKGKVQGVVDTIKGWFTGKGGFDEHSPSKWSKGVAEYVMQGLDRGFDAGLPTTISTAKSATDSIKSAIAGMGYDGSSGAAVSGGSVRGGSVVFNQYNTSPKALSRIEIYRQTQNQLRFAKGMA